DRGLGDRDQCSAVAGAPARQQAAGLVNAALVIIGLTFAFALGLGIRSRSGRQMNLTEWALGGRAFGTILIFLLLAGEIYTTFTFLGASGWAYGRGAPAFYILSYG